MSGVKRMRIRPVVGLLLWGAGAVFVLYLLFSPDGAANEPARRVARYVIESPRTLVMTGPAAKVLSRGDAVFIEDDDVFLLQVGSVSKIGEGEGGGAHLLIYPEHAGLLTSGARVRSFTVPGTAAWVIGTLLPPKRLAAIQRLTAEFIATEGDAIREALWPEIRRALLDLLSLYEKELPAALARHSDRWEALLKRHRDGVVQRELTPVLEEVSFALAREKFNLPEEVGEKLWKALPVWSLGWKAVWQEVPLTNENQVRRRFEKYVEEDAAPIIKEYAGPATKLAGEVIADSLKDARVRAALGKVFREIGSDPEFATLARELLNELVLENEELRLLMRERWETGLRDAVASAASRLEPLIRRIVDSVVLDESRAAINPRLARVLRAKVFMKDRRWVLLTGGSGASLADGAKIAGEVAHD